MAVSPRYAPAQRYHERQKVRVRRNLGWLRVFLMNGNRRAYIGEIGTIVGQAERGKGSREYLYSIVFETAKGAETRAFLESELEAAA